MLCNVVIHRPVIRTLSIQMIAAFVSTLLVVSSSPSARAAEAASRPNILLIVSDDQGYNDLGCIGEDILTPNLDRLAAEGVRCTSFYVCWPACTPSRGSLLTGRYPQRNGLFDMIRNDMVNYGHRFTEEEYAVSPEMTLGMDLREIMISQVLKEAGYATGVVGKWDGGRARRYLPKQRGFDFYYGFANTGIDYWTHERYGVPSMFRGNLRIKDEGFATDLFRREAVSFLEEHHDEPFFLYVPFNAPHGASNLEKKGVQAPEAFLRMYPGHDPESNRTKYMACVTNMDEAIGEFLDVLDEHGQAENTLVIFFSDNGGGGGSDNRPLRGSKSWMYEGGVRVPLIARWPGHLPTGAVNHEFLTSLEIFPMLTALAGASLPEGVKYDGFDMLPVLEGKAKSQRTEMFWERRNERAVRVMNYKWVDSKRGTGLYDLSTDIGEEHDLSAELPDVLALLRGRFAQWKQETDAAEPRGPFRNF